MCIEKMMVLSSYHISSATAKMIEDLDARALISAVPFHEYGWLICACSWDDDDDPIPDDLIRVIQYAQRQKCDWIMLDADGDVTDDLPVFDW